MAGKLTDAKIAGAGAGRELLENLGRGLGSLSVRVTASKRRLLYFRFKPPGGNQQRIELGVYAADGLGDTITLSKARRLAMQYAARYREHPDLRAHLEAERRNREVIERHQQEEAVRKLAEASRGTLRALLEAYGAHLAAQGRRSVGDAMGKLNKHVLDAWPAYADMRAADLKSRDVTAILRAVTDAGKGRTAGKVRSYLRAAYALALRAESDPSVPAAFVAFGIEANPVAATAALSQYNRARDRVLTAGELGFYLRALESGPQSEARDALHLALLLGGQRPAQLLRVTRADVDMHARTIRLWDPKGKRAQPRAHVLPLTEEATAIIERRLELATVHVPRRERQKARAEGRELPAPQESPWLFSSDGERPTRPETLCAVVRAVAVAATADAGLQRTRASLGMFQPRDVRRTCETMLASLGVSRDVRAQIQSHGLGGIQQRHYDRHDYMREKLAALEQWGAYLRALRDQQVAPLAQRRTKA